ncbi:MAG: hypothetical protein WAQ88_08570 [Caldicoprobacterales bacterium]
MPTKDKDLTMNTHERGGPSIVAYLFALPPVIILLVYKVVPFITALILPFKEYELTKGVSGSAWVGMRNFSDLFNSPFFTKVLSNTVTLKLEYIFLCSISAFLIALILGFIGSKFWQRVFSTIFLLPYFMPAAVFIYLVLYAMSNAGMFFMYSTESLMDPETFRLIYPILEAIRNIGIPVIIALAAINGRRAVDNRGFLHTQLIPTLKSIGLFALIQLSTLLTMDYEFLSYLQNPTIYETADTLDTFVYRTALMNNEFGLASAIWLIKYAVQLVLSILIFFLIKRFFIKGVFPSQTKRAEGIRKRGSFVGVVLSFFVVQLYLLLTTAPLAVSVVEVFGDGSQISQASSDLLSGLPLHSSFTTYAIGITFAVLVNMVITILLAYPLTVKDLPGRLLYTIFLIIVLNMGMGGVHEYLFFRGKGMHNTILPYLITGFFTLANVFVIKAIYNTRYVSVEERTVKGVEGDPESFVKRYLPRVVKPILGLGALQFAFMWNSCYPGQLVYLADPNKFSPVMIFRNIIMGAQADVYGQLAFDVIKLGAAVSIPGIIMLLFIMILGGHEIFTAQIWKN